MHELLLHASVPSSRHAQVLSILAGIAAMQPVPITEKHLVFKPSRPPPIPGRAGPNTGSQAGQIKALQTTMQGDLFYLKLVGEVTDGDESLNGGDNTGLSEQRRTSGDLVMEDGGGGAPTIVANGATNDDSSSPPPTSWTLQFRDLPDPSGRRPVTSRLMTDIPLTSGGPLELMAAMDYIHISSNLLRGHRFTYNNISLLLFQPLTLPPPDPSNPNQASDLSTQSTVALAQSLDPSRSFILQASLRVQDGLKVDRMQQGTTELMNLREMLKGAVDLEVVERLSLDTRVR